MNAYGGDRRPPQELALANCDRKFGKRSRLRATCWFRRFTGITLCPRTRRIARSMRLAFAVTICDRKLVALAGGLEAISLSGELGSHEPALRRRLECDGQANRHLGADSSPAVENGGGRLTAHAQANRGVFDRQTEGGAVESNRWGSGTWPKGRRPLPVPYITPPLLPGSALLSRSASASLEATTVTSNDSTDSSPNGPKSAFAMTLAGTMARTGEGQR